MNVDDLAAVRKAVSVAAYQRDKALAALDRLAARLEKAEREPKNSVEWMLVVKDERARAEAAEAREAALEYEITEIRRKWQVDVESFEERLNKTTDERSVACAWAADLAGRLQAVEAREAALREALADLARHDGLHEPTYRDPAAVARAALAATEEPG